MRPLLVPDAFLRTYVGDRGWGHVLVRRARGRRLWLSRFERAVAEACDGERDEKQIAQEVEATTGQSASLRQVREVLARLREAGALIEAREGMPESEGELEVETAAPPPQPRGLEQVTLSAAEAAAMRVSVVPGAGFACDGRGACCRLYDLVMLRPADVVALREAYGQEGHLPGGLTLQSALDRPRADAGNPEDLLALASVDGACMVLEEDGRCGVHRILGVARKPSGCAGYPMREVLCGDELAVGLVVECRCVVELGEGELVEEGEVIRARCARTRSAERVAESVPVSEGRMVGREWYREWREGARGRLREAGDVVEWALREAGRVGESGSGSGDVLAFLDGAKGVLEEVAEYLAYEAWNTAEVYSAGDLQVKLFGWGARAAGRLVAAAEEGREPGPAQVGERMLVEQALHVHDLLRAPHLQAGLLSLAVRLLLARADDGERPPQLLPVTSVQYLQRASYMGRLLDDAASRLAAALVIGGGGGAC